MPNVSVANTQSNVMVIAATQKTIRRSIKGMRGFNTHPRFKKQIYIYRLSFIHALYASLAFRFLFAKNLPPAAFFHAKSPLRVRVPLIQTQNKKSHLAMELSILGKKLYFNRISLRGCILNLGGAKKKSFHLLGIYGIRAFLLN